MSSYYDGPREGVASFAGRPHVYESAWDDYEGGEGTLFRLMPIADEVFQLALDDWRIWLRWEEAFYDQRTTLDEHPALPADRRQHEQLQRALGEGLLIGSRPHFLARGDFQPAERGVAARVCLGAMKVRWFPGPA